MPVESLDREIAKAFTEQPLPQGPAQILLVGATAKLGRSLGRKLSDRGHGCESVGRLDEAKRTIDDGRAMSEANAERFCLPEFHRIEGELLLARGLAEEAEEPMTRALASAHELGSRSFALRAATSLARLNHARGRSAAARDLLAPIHGQFTEGFDTADLIAAKALLEEIGGSV